MKKMIPLSILAMFCFASQLAHAQATNPGQKSIEELVNVYDSVAVTGDMDAMYITFVKGAEVHRCTITRREYPPGRISDGYHINCDPMREDLGEPLP